jgi:hypothetical protein
MRLLGRAAGPFFVFAGGMHFVIPGAYRRIVPPYLPVAEALVYASGVAEIAGGAGLIPKATRRPADAPIGSERGRSGCCAAVPQCLDGPAQVARSAPPRARPEEPGQLAAIGQLDGPAVADRTDDHSKGVHGHLTLLS